MWAVLCRLAHAAQRRFGAATATFFCLATAAQFHLPFYASRTLPNIAAFVPVVTALAHWIDGTELWLVPVLLTATTCILRCDMLIVTACVSLSMLLTRRVGLAQLALTGALSAAAAVAVTWTIDSHFWGRRLWPEAELFWFNAIEGKCAPPTPACTRVCLRCGLATESLARLCLSGASSRRRMYQDWRSCDSPPHGSCALLRSLRALQVAGVGRHGPALVLHARAATSPADSVPPRRARLQARAAY